MSVAEIKRALQSLTAEELAEVSHAISSLREGKAELPATREVQPSDSDVPEAMDAVFSKHRELLNRLAQ